MKTVFNTKQCAHVWAQQSQDYGRGNSVRFEGKTFYSYRTPIAAFQDEKTADGLAVVLITSQTYSNTTSGKHMPAVHNGLYGLPVKQFSVPIVEPQSPSQHVTNFDNFKDEANKLLASISRSGAHTLDWKAERATSYVLEATRYGAIFGLVPSPGFDTWGAEYEAFAASIYDAIDKRKAAITASETPENLAKREKERERRAELKAAKEAEAARIAGLKRDERRAEWLAGGNVHLAYYDACDDNNGALLRIKGDLLQTARGAEVPLSHAVRVFQFLKQCRERGEAWQANGRTLPVGHFRVERVDAEGNFKAGCHVINWPEVERVAIQHGLFNTPAADTREGAQH